MLLMMAPCDSLPGGQTLVYSNWGTAFSHLGVVDNGHSLWRHTVAIQWIDVQKPNIDPIPTCPPNNTMCEQLHEIVVSLKTDVDTLIDEINKHVREAKGLIPVEMNVGSKNKRGIFNFVGEASRSLFGTATEQDIEIVKKHVLALENVSHLNVNQVKRQGKQIATFIKLVDDHVSDCLAGIQANKNMFMLLAQRLNATAFLLENRFFALRYEMDTFGVALRYLLQYQRRLYNLERTTGQWLNAVHILLKGNLPIMFVPPAQLQIALDKVQQYLNTEYPTFTLTHTALGYYYEAADVVFTKTNKHLYISIGLPISATDSFFDLFSVMTLPMPTNDTSMNSTQITGHSPFFGMSRNGEYYVELSEGFYSTCMGEIIKRCPHVVSLQHRSVPSCTSSLFMDDASGIMKYCNVDYRVNHLFEGVLELGNSYFLASGRDTTWALNCENKPAASTAGCRMCVIRIPCSCHLSSTTFEIPARLTGCEHNATGVTYLHTISLTVLHSFFPTEVAQAVSGHHFSARPNTLLLPNINVEYTSWKTTAQRLDKPVLDFKVLAQNVEKQNELYATRADYIHDIVQNSQKFELSTWIGTGTFAVVLSGTALVLSSIACCRLRTLSLMVATMSRTPQTQANVIISDESHNLTYYNDWNMVEPIATEWINTIEWERVILRIMLFALLILTFKAVIWCLYKLYVTCMSQSRPQTTCLLMEIVTARHSLLVPLMQLDGHPSQIFVMKTPEYEAVQIIARYCVSVLVIDWDDTKIHYRNDSQPVPLLHRVQIPYLTARQLKSMLRDNYSIKMYLKSASIIWPLTLENYSIRPEPYTVSPLTQLYSQIPME
jgi:hypothetical protein